MDLPFDDRARAEMKRWAETWKRAQPILEEIRTEELRRMTASDSARIATEILWTGPPVHGGDRGAGLVAIRDALGKLAARV